jgi:hypothetical protein
MNNAIKLPEGDFSQLDDKARVEAGFVLIHKKWYWGVAPRLTAFLTANPTFSVHTELVRLNETEVIFKATVLDSEGVVRASGTACERHESSAINRTSSIENCETSSIGRALACAGWSGGEFASAEELSNALEQQSESIKEAHWLMILGAARELNEFVHSLSDGEQTAIFNSGDDKRKTMFKSRFRQLIAQANQELEDEAIYISTLLKEGDLPGAKERVNELSEFELTRFMAHLDKDSEATEIFNSKEFSDVPD